MNPLPPNRVSFSRRRGMALLFVLGSLAVMVIAVVSFGAFMKIERMVAANHLEVAKARQAALSGLDRAIVHIKGLNYWPASNGQTVFFAGRVMPPPPPTPPPAFPGGAAGGSGLLAFMPLNQNMAAMWDDTLNGGNPYQFDTSAAGQPAGKARVAICNAGGRVDAGALLPTPNPYAAGGMNVGGLAPPTQADIATTSRNNNMLDYFTMPEVRYLGFSGNKLNTVAKESNFTFFEMFSQKYSPVAGVFRECVYVGRGIGPVVGSPAYRAAVTEALAAAGAPNVAVTTQNLIDYIVNRTPGGNGMTSAAELGLISTVFPVDPAITLRLVGNNPHRVLDTFTVHMGLKDDGSPFTAGDLAAANGRAGPLVRGLINANTDMPNALATALNDGSVITVANRIIEDARRKQPGNCFTRKSDIGATFDTWGDATWLENDKEALLRTFVDLCDVRGNTFVILVQGISVLNGNNTGIAEIAAHVWRCPLTNRIIVRHVKWVDRDDDLLTAY